MKTVFLWVSVVFFLCSVGMAEMSDQSWQEVKKYYYLSQEVTSDPMVHYHLAMAYAYTGFIEAGFKELKLVNDLDPSFKASILERYERKIKRSRADWKDHFYYAFAMYFNDQKDDAVDEFKRSEELVDDPSIKGWIYGYIAYIHGEKKRWNEALAAINKAIELEPDGAGLHFALGIARKELDDKLGAASAILKAGTLQAKQSLGSRSLGKLARGE